MSNGPTTRNGYVAGVRAGDTETPGNRFLEQGRLAEVAIPSLPWKPDAREGPNVGVLLPSRRVRRNVEKAHVSL